MMYPDDSDCTWLITVPARHKVELSFDLIQLEAGFDFVDVYDGPTTKSNLIKRLHGVAKPKPISSSDNQMTVRFRSDESYQMKGFFARFRASKSPLFCKYLQVANTLL